MAANGQDSCPPAGRYLAVCGQSLATAVTTHPARLFYRDEAITALSIAERLAAGFGDNDPLVKGWRKELFL